MFIDDAQGQGELVGLQEVGQQVKRVSAELHRVAHGSCSLCCAIRFDLSLLGDALQVLQLLLCHTQSDKTTIPCSAFYGSELRRASTSLPVSVPSVPL